MRGFCFSMARMGTRLLSVVVALLLLCTGAFAREPRVDAPALAAVAVSELPPEARETLALIRRGGPYPYVKDGTVFGNREGVLPRRPRGYYKAFPVRTPGSRDRGARRIIAGGPEGRAAEFFYTSDHYRSFRRISE